MVPSRRPPRFRLPDAEAPAAGGRGRVGVAPVFGDGEHVDVGGDPGGVVESDVGLADVEVVPPQMEAATRDGLQLTA